MDKFSPAGTGGDETPEYRIEGEPKVGATVRIHSKGSGKSYSVSLGKDGHDACSCPAFQFKGACKHLAYVTQQMSPTSPPVPPLQTQEDGSLFVVKGAPNISLNGSTENQGSRIETLIKQKVEEIKERDKRQHVVIFANPGAEFHPEQTPYIPDSNHPALSKHTLSTVDKVAGYQDPSMVPAMYRDQLERSRAERRAQAGQPLVNVKAPSTQEVTLEVDRQVAEIIGTPTETPETKPETKKPEFTLGINRQDMNKGGHYMPNESRPYRPGD